MSPVDPIVCPECNQMRKPSDFADDDFLCMWCRGVQNTEEAKALAKAQGGFHSIQIRSSDDRCAPPANILDLALVGDHLFFDLVEYDETTFTTKTRKRAGISVYLRDLEAALQALKAGEKKPS